MDWQRFVTLTESSFLNYSYNLTTPSSPGLYLLRFGYNTEGTCQSQFFFSGCPGIFYSLIQNEANRTWGAICVRGDTDGDGVQDCWDNCPCVSNRRQIDTDHVCPMKKIDF